MRKKRVSLKFLLDEMDKMCKKYYNDGLLKEVLINSPSYRYKVIAKNKKSRSFLRKIKSFMLPYSYLEPVDPYSNVYPNSDEYKVRFSDLVRESKGANKMYFNYSAMRECGYIGHGIAHPTRFGKFTIEPCKAKGYLTMKKEMLNNWIGAQHV